ncbi:hypothetical protein F5Y00DRAFT_266400 [Daldinia vernicosa]|uniref:uncharacterized protein n=1 Tax=Daldinia vernicosa TaxID=114800 RepID=UPI0020085308|nr:uncharacterized protein F5Y00DRAFT_266400 [Daldinia vernicosa]KAI0844572.1 hypothetical protein F5Y00DRAFT_266400 [Daldinia vernicosa]
MEWKVTDEPSSSDLEREERAYQRLLEARPGFPRDVWERMLKAASDVAQRLLFKEKEPPCVSRSYVRYVACRAALKRGLRKQQEEFEYLEKMPEAHAEPFSLAYMEYWYEQTYGRDSTKDSEVQGRVVPEGVKPTDIAPLAYFWRYIADGEEAEEGVEPFSITIPASRDIAKVLAGPDELERLLVELSDELCGPEGMVFCRVGDILRPTTLFMRLRAGVDATSTGVQLRFVRAWNTLCMAAAKAYEEDISILHLVREIEKAILLATTQGYKMYQTSVAERSKAEEESRLQILQAGQESEQMARLCAAHHREMARLADEVSSKILGGNISMEEKARKLTDFVNNGDPAIPISRRSARTRVADIARKNEERRHSFIPDDPMEIDSMEIDSMEIDYKV